MHREHSGSHFELCVYMHKILFCPPQAILMCMKKQVKFRASICGAQYSESFAHCAYVSEYHVSSTECILRSTLCTHTQISYHFGLLLLYYVWMCESSFAQTQSHNRPYLQLQFFFNFSIPVQHTRTSTVQCGFCVPFSILIPLNTVSS